MQKKMIFKIKIPPLIDYAVVDIFIILKQNHYTLESWSNFRFKTKF